MVRNASATISSALCRSPTIRYAVRSEPNHIPFDEFTRQVTQVFDQVRQTNQPVLVEQNGDVFRLVPEEPRDILKGYDPQKVKAAPSASRGLFAGADTEQFLAEMDQQREQGPNRFD